MNEIITIVKLCTNHLTVLAIKGRPWHNIRLCRFLILTCSLNYVVTRRQKLSLMLLTIFFCRQEQHATKHAPVWFVKQRDVGLQWQPSWSNCSYYKHKYAFRWVLLNYMIVRAEEERCSKSWQRPLFIHCIAVDLCNLPCNLSNYWADSRSASGLQ